MSEDPSVKQIQATLIHAIIKNAEAEGERSAQHAAPANLGAVRRPSANITK